MPSTITPQKFPLESVERIAASAECFSALLSVIALFPEGDRLHHLNTCASMANDVARDLAKIVGGENV